MRTHITSADDCERVNRRFNAFHDAFALEVRWRSCMRFASNLPGEPERQYASNEERLLAAGMTPLATEQFTLALAHYNYDWPNQPIDRVVEILFAGRLRIDHRLQAHCVIREMRFGISGAAVECKIAWEPFVPQGPPIPESYFSADSVSVAETIRESSE